MKLRVEQCHLSALPPHILRMGFVISEARIPLLHLSHSTEVTVSGLSTLGGKQRMGAVLSRALEDR